MGKNENKGPADTRIMGVVHSALRRDLERARVVLASPVSDARRAALARHLGWMMDFLHRHHEGEDNGLYPLLLERDPACAGILEEMDGEHEAIHPAMDQVRDAAARFGADPAARAAVVDALDALAVSLLPHLQREELELMPLVSAAVTEAEWEKWDQDFNLAGKSPLTLAMEGHWLMDGTDAEDFKVVADLVPPVPRWIILNLLAGPYRRKRDALWAGTPAASIGSRSLRSLGLSA